MAWSDLKKILWPWLLVPLTALDWGVAWSRLPEHVAMKFGPHGQPTSWATREQAMTFDLVLLACVVGLGTFLALAVAFVQPEKAARTTVATAFSSTFGFLLLNGVLWIYQVP